VKFFFKILAISALLLGCQDVTETKDAAPVITGSSKVVSVSDKAYEKPNIVILLADDLGWADLGFRGSDIETPHIDSLARDGLTLNRFYAMPICTPTRSALMTARDPMKLGSVYAGFQPWQNGGVSPDEHFMPESFKAAGYQTAMVGKWHLGHTTQPLVPNARGFDHFFGHLNTQIDYFDSTVAGGYDLQENGKSVRRDDQYMTDVHGAEAVRYLEELRDPDKPFFLYVPFLAPHSPMQAPRHKSWKINIKSAAIDLSRNEPMPPWWIALTKPSGEFWKVWTRKVCERIRWSFSFRIMAD